ALWLELVNEDPLRLRREHGSSQQRSEAAGGRAQAGESGGCRKLGGKIVTVEEVETLQEGGQLGKVESMWRMEGRFGGGDANGERQDFLGLELTRRRGGTNAKEPAARAAVDLARRQTDRGNFLHFPRRVRVGGRRECDEQQQCTNGTHTV